mmetsp:Transcript_28452/g.21259  ORF Transcript_28452/g.21259 Transcript_28452/m.21259 type:complete len:139 (-) Transcript_28452:660-1076(-)
MLAQNNSIRHLRMSRFKLNNSDVETIVSGLCNNKEKLLSAIEFHDLELEVEGLNAFYAYLERFEPPKLQSLTFSFIQRMGDLKMLSHMLDSNKNIKKIKMININLGIECGEFMKAISHNPQFQELILCGIALNEDFFA